MAGINALLNVLLIPRLGATGAAWATALSYLFLTGSYLFFSQKLHPLPIRWRRLAVWFAMLSIVGLAVGVPELGSRGWMALWVKLSLLLVCVAVGVMLIVWRRSVHVAN
jgi:O-antigen/teichoic acid export membrane protein